MERVSKFFRSTVAGPLVALLVVVATRHPGYRPLLYDGQPFQCIAPGSAGGDCSDRCHVGDPDRRDRPVARLDGGAGVLHAGYPGQEDGTAFAGRDFPGAAAGCGLRGGQWFSQHLRPDSILHRHPGYHEHLPRAGLPDHRGHPNFLRLGCIGAAFFTENSLVSRCPFITW